MPKDNVENQEETAESGRVQPIVMPGAEQMCCYICFHIAEEDAPYETHYGDEEEFPICPECGSWNLGGYSSYARAEIITEEDLDYIVSR